MGDFLYVDIETDGLKPTTIWCAVCRYKGVSTVICNAEDFKEYMDSVPDVKVVGHNFIAFDQPVIERIWGYSIPKENIIDTLVLSRLSSPNRDGGHSLRNWGDLLKFPKGDHSDWSCLSKEMIDYCIKDTEVTQAVHEALLKELDGFSSECQELEHEVQWIIQEQERNGWLLDQRLCVTLLAQFKEEMNDVEAKLQEIFPPIVNKRYSEKVLDKEGNPKRLKDEVIIFNPGSRQQVAKRLEAKGAVWSKQTPKGKPVVDEVTLSENQHVPEAKEVLRYLLLQKRHSQIKSWLEHVRDDDGRVHGRVISNGTATGRMAHKSPNMAQVPNSGAMYGKECRSCWIVPEGRVLVGADASGLELRMLAHYMDDEDYTNEILNGDIHVFNQKSAGLPTRDAAKTFIYATIYGAGDSKIGSITGGGQSEGKRLKQQFCRNVPAYELLRDRVSNAASRGFIKGLDGRKVYIRSEHSALNFLLQSAGAIVMKKALVILDDHANKWGIDFKFVMNCHDEWQMECFPSDSDKLGMLAVASIQAAGIHFNLRCPLDGEYKIGQNWSQTH